MPKTKSEYCINCSAPTYRDRRYCASCISLQIKDGRRHKNEATYKVVYLEGEIWKEIPNYFGKYQVSNMGRVKRESTYDGNGHRIYERVLKLDEGKDGYLRVCLTKNKTEKMIKVHRLVLISFVENHENKPQCNHLNGIKTDNHVENLEWCTRKENMQHAYDNGLLKHMPNMWNNNKGRVSTQARMVLNIETGIYYTSAKEAAESCGMEWGTLAHRLSRKERPRPTNRSLRKYTPFVYC